MDFKFSKNTESENTQPAPAEKGRQNALLLLLLILIGAFSYLYFFTDLIRPQQAQKPAQAPTPEVVKKPLPSPAAQGATTAVAPAQNSAVTTTEPTKSSPPATAPEIPEVKKTEEANKAGTAGPVEKKNVVTSAVPVAKPKSVETKKSVTADAKPAVTEKKAASAGSTPKKEKEKDVLAVKAIPKENVQPKTSVKPRKAPVAKSVTANEPKTSVTTGPWTVVVGTYALEDALATDMIRVRKTGLEASVQAGPQKKTSMTRLYLADFAERGVAQSENNKLKQYTSDAFILDQGGKFGVYAGSYLLDARAASEKERLAAAGFQLTLKKVDVAIPTRKLIAGRFNEKSAAVAALNKLKSAGFKPALVRQ